MSGIKLYRLVLFSFVPFLVLALFCLQCALRDRRPRLLWVVLGATLAAMELEVWVQPHYAAPVTVVFIALAVQGIRHLQFWRWLPIASVAGCLMWPGSVLLPYV